MSNILIIKHGSLGDIVQISGILQDIRETHVDKKIFMLTTMPYLDLLSRCPHLDGVLIDNRSSFLNIINFLKLIKKIKKYNFIKVYDLQNSFRTSFYRKYLFNIKDWSSTETTLPKGKKKKEFDKDPVLERFKFQLENSNVKTKHTLQPNFSWAMKNIDTILNKYFNKKYILLLPFSSPQLQHKKWPFYNELIQIIKSKKKNIEIVISPGPNEIEEAKNIKTTAILNNGKALDIMELTGLIKKASFVIANDTGPAHIAAHTGKNGVVLFGHHTSAHKVSIETNNFRAISVDNLNNLSAKSVYLSIEKNLDLIN